MYFIPTAHLSSDQPHDRCSVATVATLLDITLERLDQEVLPRQWKYTNPLICPSVLLISTCLLGTYHMPATFSSAYKNACFPHHKRVLYTSILQVHHLLSSLFLKLLEIEYHVYYSSFVNSHYFSSCYTGFHNHINIFYSNHR